MRKNIYGYRKSESGYMFYVPLAGLFFCIQMLSTMFIYKSISFGGGIVLTASSLIYTLDYSIVNIVAEVYGKRNVTKMIWTNAFLMFVVGMTIQLVVLLPSPINNHLIHDYSEIYSSAWRQAVFGPIAVTIAYFINLYLIKKIKERFTNLKFMWRQFYSSITAEFILLLLGYSMIFMFERSIATILTLVFFGWVWKVLATLALSPLTAMIKQKLYSYENHSSIEEKHNGNDKTKDFMGNNPITLRLESIYIDDENNREAICVIQNIGFNGFEEITTSQLLKDSTTIISFDFSDQQKIIRADEQRIQQLKGNEIQIRSHRKSMSDSKDYIFTLSQAYQNEDLIVSGNEINNDKSIISKIDPADSYLIGILYGEQKILKIQDGIDEIIRENSGKNLYSIK